jgi:FKBP-type peptidyl-prolyl cis-trans isomerase SlyD
MKIAANKVVSIDYTVTTAQGELIDSSSGSAPLAYIHGTGSLIPGLEGALEGKLQGDRVSAMVPPNLGYGERDDALIGTVPKDRFDPSIEIKPGMRFQAPPEGSGRFVTVVSVENNDVVVDGNHPLAGISLHFDVTVLTVRDASPEEIEHGHVHGRGGKHG